MAFREGAYEVWTDERSAGPDKLTAFHVPTKRYWKQGRDGEWREDTGFMPGKVGAPAGLRRCIRAYRAWKANA